MEILRRRSHPSHPKAGWANADIPVIPVIPELQSHQQPQVSQSSQQIATQRLASQVPSPPSAPPKIQVQAVAGEIAHARPGVCTTLETAQVRSGFSNKRGSHSYCESNSTTISLSGATSGASSRASGTTALAHPPPLTRHQKMSQRRIRPSALAPLRRDRPPRTAPRAWGITDS